MFKYTVDLYCPRLLKVIFSAVESTFRVPTHTGKPGKMGSIFQSGKSQGILNRLEKSGKITQNTGKLREFQTNIICYFLVIFKLTVYYFAKMHQVFS